MAPYIPPRSARLHKRKHEAAALINDLADELLLQVMRHLDTPDILNLRVACKNAVGPSNSIIQARCKTIIVHPTTTSLRRLIAICAHPLLSKQVEQLVLLGKPSLMWRCIEVVQKGESVGPRDQARDLAPFERRHRVPPRSSVLPPKSYADTFKPWPCWIDTDGKESHHGVPLNSQVHFNIGYQVMIRTLEQLPNLHMLAFHDRIPPELKGRSFNQVAQTLIESHARGCASHMPRKHLLCTKRADCEVLYGLLACRSLHFDSLATNCELPFMDMVSSRHDGWGSIPMRLCANGMVDLTLTMDDGWRMNGLHRAYKSLIQCSESTLRNLRLVVTQNASVNKPQGSDLVSHVVGDMDIPHLQVLQLEFHTSQAARTSRPCLQFVGPNSNIQELLRSVPNVSINGLIFECSHGPQGHNVRTATEHVLDLLARNLSDTKNVKWVIPRFQHHELCKREDTESTAHCTKYFCGHYATDATDCSYFETLAARRGIVLDEERQVWDFGEWAMRQTVPTPGDL